MLISFWPSALSRAACAGPSSALAAAEPAAARTPLAASAGAAGKPAGAAPAPAALPAPSVDCEWPNLSIMALNSGMAAMSSSKLPALATRPEPSAPPSSQMTPSHWRRYCSAFVTSRRVRPRSSPTMHSSKMALPTSASSALSGSSKRSTSAPESAARARLTRCFCPPERLMPRAPISGASPAGSAARSMRSWHASMTAS